MTDFIDKLAANGVAFTFRTDESSLKAIFVSGLRLSQKIRQFPATIFRESDRDEHPDHSVGHS